MDSGSLLLGFLDFYGNHFDPRRTGISVGRSRYFSRSAPLPPAPDAPPVAAVPGAPGAARMFYGQVIFCYSLTCTRIIADHLNWTWLVRKMRGVKEKINYFRALLVLLHTIPSLVLNY